MTIQGPRLTKDNRMTFLKSDLKLRSVQISDVTNRNDGRRVAKGGTIFTSTTTTSASASASASQSIDVRSMKRIFD